MPLYIDNSMLSSLYKCELQFAVRYVRHWTSEEDSWALQAGTAVHSVLETYFKTWDAEQAIQNLNDYHSYAAEHIPADHRLSGTNVARIIHQYIETTTPNNLPFLVTNPELVEIGFEVPLIRGVTFFGRIDLAVMDLQRQWWYVVDHKTTGRMAEEWREQQKYTSQYTGYVWVLSQMVKEPVVGAMVNGIELSKLPSDPKRKCAVHQAKYSECGQLHARFELLPTMRTPHQINDWLDTAVEGAKRYKHIARQVKDDASLTKLTAQGTMNGSCTFCQFKQWCHAGRDAEQLPYQFIQRPWTPYKEAA